MFGFNFHWFEKLIVLVRFLSEDYVLRIVGNNLGGGARLNVFMINDALNLPVFPQSITLIPKPPFEDFYSSTNLVPFRYIHSINFVVVSIFLLTRPKLVTLHLRNVAIIYGFFCLVLRIDFLVVVHAPNLPKFNLREKWIRFLYRFVLNNATQVVFISNSVLQSVTVDLNLKRDNRKFKVIENASYDFGKNMFKPLEVRNLEKIVIVVVGELTERKGVRDLPIFVEKLVACGLDKKIDIHIYGEGPEKQFLLSSLSGFKNCTLMGYEKDHKMIYSRATHLLMLSNNEAFGRVVIEAASFGIVPVLRRSGAFPDIAAKLDMTYLFDNIDDLVSIFKSIKTLSLKMRNNESKRVRQNFVKHFSFSRFSNDWHNLMENWT